MTLSVCHPVEHYETRKTRGVTTFVATDRVDAKASVALLTRSARRAGYLMTTTSAVASKLAVTVVTRVAVVDDSTTYSVRDPVLGATT